MSHFTQAVFVMALFVLMLAGMGSCDSLRHIDHALDNMNYQVGLPK